MKLQLVSKSPLPEKPNCFRLVVRHIPSAAFRLAGMKIKEVDYILEEEDCYEMESGVRCSEAVSEMILGLTL